MAFFFFFNDATKTSKNDVKIDKKLTANDTKTATLENNFKNISTNKRKRSKLKRPLHQYRYTLINDYGKKESGTFDAESEEDIRNYFAAQKYQVLQVKRRSSLDSDVGFLKIRPGDLSFALTQLSTYIKSGIPLAEAVRILAKQTKKTSLKKSYNELVYQLLKGESLSDAMDMQEKVFPKMLINMVRTAEMTGDLPTVLDDMADYYASMDQTRKQMRSAMTYPIVVLILAFGVLVFMLTYLVPQFSALFEENGAEMPFLTQMILNISDFVRAQWFILLLIVAAIVGIFVYCYKTIQGFRKSVQVFLMHVPVIGNIIIYNEVANFTKTFSSLLNHGVFITDSMEILSQLTDNEVYKELIYNTLENLGRGESISSAYKGHWAFPLLVS